MHVDKYERQWLIISSVVIGVFFASLLAGFAIYGVRPPTPIAHINPANLDETQFGSPGLRHMGGNRYEAYILAKMWSFDPREITVPEGAIVDFYLTSSDVTHGFIIEHHNANIEVVPGVIARQTITFDKTGRFAMLCHEYCGTGHQIMYGFINVEEAEVEVAVNEGIE